VIQYSLDDVRPNSNLIHPRGASPSQIVRRERGLNMLTLAPSPEINLHAGFRDAAKHFVLRFPLLSRRQNIAHDAGDRAPMRSTGEVGVNAKRFVPLAIARRVA
jgi:hypothetical protein